MKGGLSAILGTVKALKESGTKLAGDLWITAVVGHEDVEAAKDGPLAMCEDIRDGRIKCDSILIAEGDSEIWMMSTGSAVFTISLNSKLNGTHSNNITFKENPIRFVGLIIQAIDGYQDELNTAEPYPLAGTARIDIGKINAGDYYNRTPSLSLIEGIVRWLPGSSAAETKQKLLDIISPIAQAGDLNFNVSFAMEREPFEVSRDNPAVQAVAKAAKTINGKSPNFIGKRIVGDANIYMGLTGVPTFYYGLGYQTAHSDSEWVNIEALVRASQIYTFAAIDYLGIS
jgi:acetylornithine deacetylase/succinyl-diaminopimelate desuccinylase-like protein